MPDIHLALTLKAGLLVIAIPTAALIAYWAYWFTIPPISGILKSVLVGLRSCSLALIFLMLGEPLLSLLTHSTDPPVTTLLIDNSKSMTIIDHRGDRKKILTEILGSSALASLRSTGGTDYVLFDLSSRELSVFSPDSLTFLGDGTDIGGALTRLKQQTILQNIQGVVLLSDGQYTVGTNPLYEAEELGVPVFTVGIGDSSEQKDIQVRSVIANEITYVGNRVPVNATVKSSGFGGERTEVTLQQGGAVLDTRVLVLEPGMHQYAIPLSFVPSREGIQKFTVEISRLPGELTNQNNSLSFFTKVLKSKMQVLLVAGSPNQDVAFIRRALEADKNIDLKPFLGQKDGTFSGNPLTSQVIADADCIVLVDFPNSTSSPSSFALIQGALNSSKPFLLVISRTMDFGKLSAIEADLPFVIGETSTDEYQVFVAIPESKQRDPILQLSAGSPDSWSKLSPVFRIQAAFRAKPESEILGTVRIQSVTTREPILISRNVNRKKSFAVLAYGIWRWKMFAEAGSGTENLLDDFLSNTVRWLTTREDDRRVKVQPVKSTFSGQDPIEFSGQVYDENYKPIDDAAVQVTVTRGKQSSQIFLHSLGTGQYEGSLDRLDEGDYSFAADARQSGNILGEDKGTFSVGGQNAEFLDTRMNKLLLQQIAARTGGKYYDANNLESLFADISSLPGFKPREVTHADEIELWNSKWMLGCIIVLLAIEWFLRKRNGMI